MTNIIHITLHYHLLLTIPYSADTITIPILQVGKLRQGRWVIYHSVVVLHMSHALSCLCGPTHKVPSTWNVLSCPIHVGAHSLSLPYQLPLGLGNFSWPHRDQHNSTVPIVALIRLRDIYLFIGLPNQTESSFKICLWSSTSRRVLLHPDPRIF